MTDDRLTETLAREGVGGCLVQSGGRESGRDCGDSEAARVERGESDARAIAFCTNEAVLGDVDVVEVHRWGGSQAELALRRCGVEARAVRPHDEAGDPVRAVGCSRHDGVPVGFAAYAYSGRDSGLDGGSSWTESERREGLHLRE